MRRIGNYLFVEQCFRDAEPHQAIVAINAIENICAHEIANCGQRTVIETSNSKIALSGNHDDNIIELSILLAEQEKRISRKEDSQMK